MKNASCGLGLRTMKSSASSMQTVSPGRSWALGRSRAGKSAGTMKVSKGGRLLAIRGIGSEVTCNVNRRF